MTRVFHLALSCESRQECYFAPRFKVYRFNLFSATLDTLGIKMLICERGFAKPLCPPVNIFAYLLKPLIVINFEQICKKCNIPIFYISVYFFYLLLEDHFKLLFNPLNFVHYVMSTSWKRIRSFQMNQSFPTPHTIFFSTFWYCMIVSLLYNEIYKILMYTINIGACSLTFFS